MDLEHGPLVDRNDELEELVAALSEARLVSIIGPGGVGKTRLGVAVGARVRDHSGVRLWWIELAAGDAADVADAVASVVGDTRAGVDVLDALVDALREAPTVLMLDNCEQAVDGAGAVVTLLLARCPELRLLVTSQVPMGLEGEHVLTLAPLPLPADDDDLAAIMANPAVEFFAARAEAASPGFELTAANTHVVAEICRRLDGLPLAIELAAALVPSIGPDEIVRYLDDRLQLAQRAPFHRSGRHRGLVTALSWSYELLSRGEQRAFDGLSVFAGTFTSAAACAVTGAESDVHMLDALGALVGRSMLVMAGTPTEPRYRVLEVLGEFGRRNLERGDGAKAAFDGLRRHYVASVEEAAAGLQRADEARWVDTLRRDLPNVRTVFTRAVKTIDVDTALRLVVALFDFSFFRMRREIGPWAEEAVALPGAEAHHLYGAAAAVAGYLAWQRGAPDAATRLTDIALSRSPLWIAFDSLGTIELYRGRIDQATSAYERAVDLAATTHNEYQRAIALSQLAFAHTLGGRDDATAIVAAAEALAGSTGNPTAIATSGWSMGTALFESDPRRALESLERSMEISRGVDNRLILGAATTTAEELYTKLGERSVVDDLAAAVGQADYWMTMGHAPTVWLTVRRIARDFVALEQFETAAMAFGAEATAASKLPLRVREGDRHQLAIRRAEQALGSDEYARHAARGAALSPEQLVAALRTAADAVIHP